MRCLNCHTVLADSDLSCPACGMRTTTQAAQAVRTWDRPGGVQVAAVERSPAAKWTMTIGFLLLGILLLLGALMLLMAGLESAEQKPHPVTAAELRKVVHPNQIPHSWVSYSPTDVVDTGVVETSLRSGTVRTKFIFIPIEDRWLLASVPPGYGGGELVGQLVVWDAPQNVTNRMGPLHSEQIGGMLPYQFDCEHDMGIDSRLYYGFAGLLGFIGAAMFIAGLSGLFSKSGP